MCSQASPQPTEVTELYLSTEFVPSRELCVNYLLINTVFCAVTRMSLVYHQWLMVYYCTTIETKRFFVARCKHLISAVEHFNMGVCVTVGARLKRAFMDSKFLVVPCH